MGEQHKHTMTFEARVLDVIQASVYLTLASVAYDKKDYVMCKDKSDDVDSQFKSTTLTLKSVEMGANLFGVLAGWFRAWGRRFSKDGVLMADEALQGALCVEEKGEELKTAESEDLSELEDSLQVATRDPVAPLSAVRIRIQELLKKLTPEKAETYHLSWMQKQAAAET